MPTAVRDPITGGPINPGQAVVGAWSSRIGPQLRKQLPPKFQPKVSVRYEVTPDINLYGNWGIGFKSGGFNNQGSAAIINANFNAFIGAGVNITDNIARKNLAHSKPE